MNKHIHYLFIALTMSILAILSAASRAAAADTTGAANMSNPRYGLYIHYGIATFAYPGEQGQIPVERFANGPVDVKSWAHAAKTAGMTFAVLTAKHESGFCLWDSADYNYDIAKSPFKGDIIADFIAACNAEGILPGLHYSITDSLNDGGSGGRGPVSDVYFNLIKKHLTELHTRYPGIRVQVLDGIGRLSHDQFVEVSQLIKRLNPQCVLLNDSNQEDRGPRYTAATTIRGWFWQPKGQLTPAMQLFNRYNQAKTAGQIFILNVGPKPSGQIPDEQMAALMRVKELMDLADMPVTAESLKRGLILHFDFDQPPAGDHVSDLSGSGNDGVAVGIQWVSAGHRGGSAQFAKDNSYITVRNNDSVNPAQFTLSAWINTSYEDTIWRRIFDKATGVGYDLTMCGNEVNGKSWRGQLALEAGKQWAPSGVKVDDGHWHHVVGTYDGSELQDYIDGQPVGPPRLSGGPPAHTSYDLTIGADRSNPNASIGEVGPSFYGMMDEVMMFNRALAPWEVRGLYDSQKEPTDTPLNIATQQPRNPQANSPPPQNKPSAADRLKQVKDLFNQGLINKDQYDQKVKEIMDSL